MSWYWIVAIVLGSLQAYVICGLLTRRFFETRGWYEDEIDALCYGIFWPLTITVGGLVFGARLWIDVSKRLVDRIASLPVRRRRGRDFPTARTVRR